MFLSVWFSQYEADAGCESSSGCHIQAGGLALLSHLLPAVSDAEIVRLSVALRVHAEGEGPIHQWTPFRTLQGHRSAESAGHMPPAGGKHTRSGV